MIKVNLNGIHELDINLPGTTGSASLVDNGVAELDVAGHGNGGELQLSDGTGVPGNLAVFDADGNVTDGGPVPAGGTFNGSMLINGGGVVWLTDYQYHVSAATYMIGGVIYTSPETTVTLSPSDPTDDRLDVIYVDTAGTVQVQTGVAAPNPVEPTLDVTTQLQLVIVLVQASTTAPGVTNVDIYHENTEWTGSTSGSGYNLASTNNPHSGTKDIEATSVAKNSYVALTAGSPVTPSQYNNLVFYIQLKSAWTTQSIVIRFYSSGAAVGSAVTLKSGQFGLSGSNTSSYQQIVIPLSNFSLTGTVNAIRFTAGVALPGYYLDDIILQGGITQIINPGMVYRGEWSGTTAYSPQDFVKRTGASVIGYVCKHSVTSTTPPETDTTNWDAVSSAGGGGSGTVTSVALTMPAEFSIAGSPVTTAGTLAVTKANQSANQVYAGPSTGSPAAPGFRTLVSDDIPALAESKVTNLVTDLAACEKTVNKDVAGGYAGLDGSGKIVVGEIPNLPESQITNLVTDLAACEKTANKDIAGGYAGLDGSGKISTSEIPNLPESQITNLVTDLAACEKTANKDAANGYAGLDAGSMLKTSEQAHPVNNQTGTSYTFVDGDRSKLVTFSNAAAIAGTLPQAGASSSFLAGWHCWVENRGAGTLTITPTTSTIDGAASLALTTDQGVFLVSDGTNYYTVRGMATGTSGGVTNVTATAPLASSGGATPDISLADKHGNGSKVQMSDNTGTSQNFAKYDANGNVTDGAASLSTDGTFAGNSDSLIPSQKATKTYVDGHIGAIGVAGITVDGGGTTPGIGSKGYVQVPYAATILSWTVLADTGGTLNLTVKKCTYANFPTTTSIVASSPVTLSSAQKNTDSTLTGWTTSITAGDILEFYINSVGTLTKFTLELKLQKV